MLHSGGDTGRGSVDAESDAPAVSLAAAGVSKRFPGVVANDAVDFALHAGEVHALLGENGSGKTTLCKILTGLHRPDDGQVLVDGEPVSLRSPHDAHRHGVFMVHQHFSLVERLSVAENVALGWTEEIGWRMDRRALERRIAEAAERFHMHVDPAAPVWRLSVGERQRVEILKALIRGARTLILDEPTTVLTPQEADQLFASLRRMADHGGSVVFISHKLHEVLAVCDRVTVLRQGRTAGTVALDGAVDKRALAAMMIGREVELQRREDRVDLSDRPVVLSLDDVVVHNEQGRPVVKHASLDVRAGEIVGVAGVAGNGQLPLAEAIAGLSPCAAGSVAVAGERLRSGDPAAAIARRIGYVPEDRMGVGLAPGLKVKENIVLKSFRTKAFSGALFLRGRRVHAAAAELVERFDVKGSPDTLVRQLSGGNAQKVLLAREMSDEPQVLVIAAPTRGLDVGAMSAVRALLVEAAARGAAILMISEDLDELMDLADRIAVMCDGRITGVLEAQGADVDEIGLLMMGQEAAA